MIFRDFSEIQQHKSMRPGTVACNPQVIDLRAQCNTPDGLISYRLTNSDKFQALPHRLSGRNSGALSITVLFCTNNHFPLKKKVKEKKWQHLQEFK